MIWSWTVQGMQLRLSHGSMERPHEDSGDYEADSASEVVEWLAECGPFWDTLDQDCPVAIFIRPIAVPDDSDRSA